MLMFGKFPNINIGENGDQKKRQRPRKLPSIFASRPRVSLHIALTHASPFDK